MAFEFAQNKLPLDEMQELLKGLEFFADYRSAEPPLQQELKTAAQGEGQAWRVFVLTLADVLPGGKGLKDPKAGGWRVAARVGTQVIAGDIYTGDTVARRFPYPLAAGTPRLACVRLGQEILLMLAAIQRLKQPSGFPNIPAQPFNLHLLVLPGLVTDALWLQPQNPAGTSYVVPFRTLVDGLEDGHAYPEQDFLQRIRPFAQQWVEFSRQEASRTAAHPFTGVTSPVPVQS